MKFQTKQELLDVLNSKQLVYEHEDIVIVRVHSFEECKLLAYDANWNISRSETCWKNSIEENMYAQYIIFDFFMLTSKWHMVAIAINLDNKYVHGYDLHSNALYEITADEYMSTYKQYLLGVTSSAYSDATEIARVNVYSTFLKNTQNAQSVIDAIGKDNVVEYDVENNVVIVRIDTYDQFCQFDENIALTFNDKSRRKQWNFTTQNRCNEMYIVFDFKLNRDDENFSVRVFVGVDGRWNTYSKTVDKKYHKFFQPKPTSFLKEHIDIDNQFAYSNFIECDIVPFKEVLEDKIPSMTRRQIEELITPILYKIVTPDSKEYIEKLNYILGNMRLSEESTEDINLFVSKHLNNKKIIFPFVTA